MSRVALQDTITTPATGIAAPSATITIRETDGTGPLATVYAARTGSTEVNNPLDTGETGLSNTGFLSVYLEPGLYWVEVDTGGVTRSYEIEAQGYSVNLDALAGLTGAANRVPYFTGASSMALATFTSFGRSLVDDASASAARTTLGLGSAAVAPIVGTVSQSGGVPTGAIIERGSNANGEYTRWADGTQICFVRAADMGSIVAAGSGTFDDLYRTNNFSLTWPASFAAGPVASWALQLSGDTGVSANARALGLQGTFAPFKNEWANLRACRYTSDATNRNALLSVTAVGRWFL